MTKAAPTFTFADRSPLEMILTELSKQRPDLLIKKLGANMGERTFEITLEGDRAIAQLLMCGSFAGMTSEKEIAGRRAQIISCIEAVTGLTLEPSKHNFAAYRKSDDPAWRPTLHWLLTKNRNWGCFIVDINTHHIAFRPDSMSVTIIDDSQSSSGKQWTFKIDTLEEFAEQFRNWWQLPEVQNAKCITIPVKKTRKKA